MASVHPKLSQSEKADDKSSEEHSGYLSSWRLAIVIFSLCLATFLLAIDVYMVSIAVPQISAVFHSLDDIAWYGSAYLLALTAFQPVMGYFYKYFDVRVTYLISIMIFEGNTFGSYFSFPFCVMSMNKSLTKIRQWAPSCALLPPTHQPSSAVEQSPASVQPDFYRELWAS